jgi:hypothetical protein
MGKGADEGPFDTGLAGDPAALDEDDPALDAAVFESGSQRSSTTAPRRG